MSIYSNPYFLDAATNFFKLCDHSKLRKICRNRENRTFDIRCYQRGIQERDKIIKQKDSQIAIMKRMISLMDDKIAIMDDLVTEKYAHITEITAQLAQLKSILEEKGIQVDSNTN